MQLYGRCGLTTIYFDHLIPTQPFGKFEHWWGLRIYTGAQNQLPHIQPKNMVGVNINKYTLYISLYEGLVHAVVSRGSRIFFIFFLKGAYQSFHPGAWPQRGHTPQGDPKNGGSEALLIFTTNQEG